MTHIMSSEKKRLLWIIGVFLILRISLIFILGKPGTDNWNSWMIYPDSSNYISFAQDMSDGSYNEPSFRTPVYPFFLYVTNFIINGNWLLTIILQQILVIIAAFLIFSYLFNIVGRFAYLALIVFLLEPNILIYSYAILPDILMLFIQIIATLLMLSSIEKTYKNKVIVSVIIAFLLSVGVLAKPVLMYSFVGFVIFILIFYKYQFWKKAIIAVIFIAVFYIPLISLQQYNLNKFGFKSISTQASWEKAGSAIALRQQIEIHHYDRDLMLKEMDQALSNSGYNANKPDYKLRDEVYNSLFRSIAKKYPIHAAYYSIIGSIHFLTPGMNAAKKFFNIEDSSKQNVVRNDIENFHKYLETSSTILILIVTIVFSLVLFFSWILSFVWLKKKKFLPFLYFVNGWFIYSVVLLGRYSSPRYRITFIWGFVMLVSFAIYWFIEKRRRTLLLT